MYKAQFKSRSPYESWTTLGQFGTEAAAISAALAKKNSGAILVRVTNKSGSIVYTGSEGK
jgi:hypothetical protein